MVRSRRKQRQKNGDRTEDFVSDVYERRCRIYIYGPRSGRLYLSPSHEGRVNKKSTVLNRAHV